MTIANRVTLARIAAIPLVISFLLFRLYGLAAMIFLLLSFSDAIDGYIARRYNQVSDLGKLLDPLADKVLVICVLITLVGLGKADSLPVVIITTRELLVSGIRIYTAKSGEIIAASPLAKWKTVSQMIAVFMLTLRLPLAAGMLWAAVVFSLISGGNYLWQSKILNQLKLN
ncbi:CDP-diacylglycerol--glycerol-3-phosphate 3-phosphatidyltransferase [candidate division WOR-1 bacterium RIFCSPLOWO2_02_FULL_46_20]|uniref:CDP-diacylglycerol--glycerol-3-phosphate 3-phosphatidyltransferase n=2 Tax=Saganbacteria TaxID=1703751 RepID=A0A1F4RD21_UNCSA|nr:MAG: CDP-diacylglycerol--glycerol-3-phosphate 3-phosphatidyltransferase [candidate division WOR-1 bacterium RIFCSPHIGHO2_02_FULL_45_12]OGC06070.1 MAG: CDP-diacylglycerol--glycerol-3-phosphate 3-phosphatidyltransferase [candidate division WOR-1 bacterium RIFCSPLOWO2_02_FULL_46_20]OGC09247.1 MAG: CDP-diacylglycerol--glycerol-3-phosphate 3-phosphatidyltransferase [candidate division WOR-1 bacterium RIFCSPLOWO2_12_FULL_45_9]